jgi:sugar phosphate isomerase/epimerase
MNRRELLGITATAAITLASNNVIALAEDKKKRNIKLGFDNFSIRAMGWKAPDLIKYAASQKVDVLMMSDLDVYESFEDDYLKKIKMLADEHGLQLHAGTGSICPSSNAFNDKHGTAVEHIKKTIKVANALGSPVARCYQGNSKDRQSDGGIFRHIEDTVNVCRGVRSYAMDMGVKIAIENHAGDMQAWELKELIEAAGSDYVGTTIDSGNATWTLENPIENLKILGPYAVSAGMRDSAIWKSEKGAMVEWTNMGDGGVDWNAYLDLWEKLCPECPFVLEIISGIGAREYPYLNEDFWGPYDKVNAAQFSRFVAMAEKGQPFTAPADRPSGARSDELNQKQQMYDLEKSLEFCKTNLSIGLKE